MNDPSAPKLFESGFRIHTVNLIKWLDSSITMKSACVVFLGVAISWVLYLLFGHRLIETMYTTTPGTIIDRILKGKSSTPLEDYLEAADTLIVLTTFHFFAVFLPFVLLIKKPRLLLYGSGFVAALSFAVFCAVEWFPSVGDYICLDNVRFHYYNKLYIGDDKLIHRLRPYLRTHSRSEPQRYPLSYGIEVEPTTIEWITDEDGFRNADTTRFSDVIIIGDGFIEEGQSLVDTFASRLEKHLSPIRVRNLGTGGHGPFQYLEVLKRYGIKRGPKYVLIGFNEVNDITDTERYLQWQEGKEKGASVLYDSRTRVVSRPFFDRYGQTLLGTFHHIQNAALMMAHRTLENFNTYRKQPIHKDVVLVELGNAIHRMLFIDRLITKAPEEILASNSGRRLKEILLEFKNLCARNKIIPMIMFIPSADHIYAEYSTQQSGRSWLKIRPEQIAAKANVEQAISTLAHALGIEFVSLSVVFESAAKNGKMLYYPLSTHWNSEGMEVAAVFVAGMLKSKITTPGMRQ